MTTTNRTLARLSLGLSFACGLATAAALSGCATSGAGAKADATVATINSMCPIGGDPFDNTKVNASMTRTWKGANIGFCCESCISKYDKMDDAGKSRILALAKENKVE
ncbi:MAG: hypothetical protein ACKVU4_04170 [Phycisphaerales bacterium]